MIRALVVTGEVAENLVLTCINAIVRQDTKALIAIKVHYNFFQEYSSIKVCFLLNQILTNVLQIPAKITGNV